ncbi:1-aminocyclopropane-1-carboxylate deaminase/D-cysteine desulfhydrase [Sinosporangium siamense]|uniref:1-aminocyclopropane-1-carboxylate deaminase n=1 Tax=Sinosporangium siamense TaxID=1367973 RepID=A0A919R9S9_9ACTN|nr:pyridoxal-phosphate dependent enzyme [Sinosporangium siamense]GII90025.1 1-aminocyclopropane-1-carboxylate deaminase [Sinosporangium siamense]
MEPRLPSPLMEIDDDRLGGVRLLLKRDDLLHPEVTGNKWRKLIGNLGHDRVLGFGGAHSNLIRALASAGRLMGFETVGVIRGEERLPLNPTLAHAVACGMRLTYLDRATYRLKHTPAVTDALRERFGTFHLLPEGGSNPAAVRGCAGIAREVGDAADVVCCPVGTGGTLAGISAGLSGPRRAVGFAVLKGAGFLNDEVARLQRETLGEVKDNWSIDLDHHFGGYARVPRELEEFAADFEVRHGVAVERIYVAKMLYGVLAMARDGRFAPGTRVAAVVTGVPWTG